MENDCIIFEYTRNGRNKSGKITLCDSTSSVLKMRSHRVYYFILLFKFAELSFTKLCEDYQSKLKLEFYPLRHCQRSNKTIIASTNVESVKLCASYARSRRGLAFNFSPKSRENKNFFEIEANKNDTKKDVDDKSLDVERDFDNCEVLECPENRNFSFIVNDTRFDYYTMYAHPPPIENATCIPSLGMFLLYKERKNYSTAYSTCKSIKGQIAHIASERRTNEISKLLLNSDKLSSTSKEMLAFVGLNETTRGKFATSNSEPLECFDYRAFAPGHPPEIRKPSCVALTDKASWKVMSCIKKVMFVCEIFANGPNPFVKNIHKKCSIKRPNNRFSVKKKVKTSDIEP